MTLVFTVVACCIVIIALVWAIDPDPYDEDHS